MLAHELIPLNFLAPGESASIREIVGGTENVRRLHELGMRDGATVEMIQSGSPCIVRLAGQKFCFRVDELLQVLVRRGVAT
jgi:Fe2+ transport system protein FeoA